MLLQINCVFIGCSIEFAFFYLEPCVINTEKELGNDQAVPFANLDAAEPISGSKFKTCT